jgi:hypothetical protein
LNNTRGFPSAITQVALTRLLPSFYEFIFKVSQRTHQDDHKQAHKIEPIQISMVAEILKIFSGIVGLLSSEKRECFFFPICLVRKSMMDLDFDEPNKH